MYTFNYIKVTYSKFNRIYYKENGILLISLRDANQPSYYLEEITQSVMKHDSDHHTEGLLL